MKAVLAFASVVLFTAANPQSVKDNSDLGLPELHTIKSVTLSPSFSCRPQKEFQQGYGRTALFLSEHAIRRNSPELLFNGACGAEDFFQSSSAGDDMSLIADLGPIPLENVTSIKAFNFKRVHSFDLYSSLGRWRKWNPCIPMQC